MTEMGQKGRQAGMSMGNAIGKERFRYYSFFFGTLAIVLPLASHKTHNPVMLAPLVPLSILWLF